MNPIYEQNLARGAKACRNGDYDMSTKDHCDRQRLALLYLRKKGVTDWSFDRDYSGLQFTAVKSEAAGG